MLAAPPIAGWLHAPDLVPLLRVVALVPFIRGFTSLALDWRARRVDLRPTATTELVANVVELTAGIVLAALTHSAWGLVAAMLIGVAARTAWSYRYTGFRPRFVLLDGRGASADALRQVARSDRTSSTTCRRAPTTSSSAATSGGRSLGSYRIAYRLANLPTTEIVSVLETVAFPALAARARESRDVGDHDVLPLPHVDVRAGRPAGGGVRRAGPADRRRPARPGVRRRPRRRWRSCASPATCGRSISTAGSLVLGLGRPALDTAMGAMRAVVLVVGIITARPARRRRRRRRLAAVAGRDGPGVDLQPAPGRRPPAARASPIAVGRLPVAAAAGGAAWAVAHLPWPPLLQVRRRRRVAGVVGLARRHGRPSTAAWPTSWPRSSAASTSTRFIDQEPRRWATGVTAIVVTYDSAAVIGGCLDALAAHAPRVPVVVVDNGSRDGDAPTSWPASPATSSSCAAGATAATPPASTSAPATPRPATTCSC